MNHVSLDRADYFGFREVPFHRHLGVRFWRESEHEPPLVGLPAAMACGAGATHSPAAVYTIAEIASALAASDTLAGEVSEFSDALIPVMLATGASFTVLRDARGDIFARAALQEDPAATVERLRIARKVRIRILTRVFDNDAGEEGAVGELELRFYIRLMDERRLQAIKQTALSAAGASAQRAREV
jgi:hypothetical protein